MLEATLSRALEATLRVCAVVRDHRQLQEALPWLTPRVARMRAVLCQAMSDQTRLRDPEAIEARLRTELLPALEELERAIPKRRRKERAAACFASGAWQSRVLALTSRVTDLLVAITGNNTPADTAALDQDQNARTQQHAAIQVDQAAADPAPFASAEYECGICLRSVRDPVVLLDSGQTYCRTCIEVWVSSRVAAGQEPTDPLTRVRLNVPLQHVENWALVSSAARGAGPSTERATPQGAIRTVEQLRAAIHAGRGTVIDLQGHEVRGSGWDTVAVTRPGVTLRNGRLTGVQLVIEPSARRTCLDSLCVSGCTGDRSVAGARSAVRVKAAGEVVIVGCCINDNGDRGLSVDGGAQVPVPVCQPRRQHRTVVVR
ncbi:unnamed protein product [Pedinophyceae sp. YPF-701]|nr:unnamed protein product [Pedinophyceae sp. YPF-701]